MIPAPRELRMPSVYTFEFGTTGEGPIKLTLKDMPFWDTAALLSSISYEVTTPPPAESRGVMPSREKRYRIQGLIGTAHRDGALSFLFDRSTPLNNMLSGVKDAYTTSLTATYAERARSETRINPSLQRPINPPTAEAMISQELLLPDVQNEARELLQTTTSERDRPHTLV